MTKADDSILELLVRNAKSEKEAIKHVIMFARNEKVRKQKRSLDFYADLILKITEK